MSVTHLTPLRHRAAMAEDVPAVVAMMVEFNRFEAITWSPEQGEPVVRELLASPHIGCISLLEENGVAVGYFVLTWGFDLEWGGRDAMLTELFLLQHARNRGLGVAAVQLVESEARAHGAHAVHLMVRHENAAARRVYVKSGFKAPPRLLMTKDLRS